MKHKIDLRLKSNLSSELINSKLSKNGGFGFLFHATDWQTLEFAFENIETNKLKTQSSILWNVKPFVHSFIEYKGNPIGVNMAIPVPIDLWIGSSKGLRNFREKQFFPALELANDCNLKMVAMGASTPYACNYGKLTRPLKNPSLTTGHAATIATLKKWAICASNYTGCKYENITLAIFGASGRLGKALSNYIAHSSPPKEIILIDLKDKFLYLKSQAEEILRTNTRKDLKVSIYCFESNQEMPKFDGAILVSNNSTPYLTEHHLKKAKFWIDDSHPRAASVEAELKSRKDTLYVECYIRGPEGFSTNFPFRLPTTQDCYTCCAEGFLSWREGIDEDFITGIPDIEKINLVDRLLDKYDFHLGPFSGKNGDLI